VAMFGTLLSTYDRYICMFDRTPCLDVHQDSCSSIEVHPVSLLHLSRSDGYDMPLG
jgi:hypothetical protein